MMRAILILALLLPTGTGVDSEPADLDIVENVLIERVTWPVRLRPTAESGCEEIDAAHIEVREDGVEMRVTELDRHHLPIVHVLLIDTSGSLVGDFSDARRAAARYVRALPATDRFMLATFDEDLRLWVGPTLDTDAAIRELDSIDAHSDRYTSLWDATSNLLTYLDGIADRKVLVVVTDGCDSLSLPAHTYESTLELVIHSTHLTVLPIVVGGTRTCPYSGTGTIALSPRTHLESLARRSGGELFHVGTYDRLAGVFEDIILRLSQEAHVVWVGSPFGAGPKDRPRSKDRRWRTVKIRSRAPQGCRVISAGPPSRLVERVAARAARPPVVRLTTDDGRMVGVVRDMLRQRGHLYDVERSRRSGRIIISRDRPPLIASRPVEVVLPEFETLRADPPDPARQFLDVMEWCLETPRCADPETAWPLPFLVQGQTFFDIRADLARALLGAPGYGEWARARVRADREQEAERLLDAAAARQPLTELARSMVRTALLERPLGQREILNYLGAWLGDDAISSLLATLEVEAANAGGEELARRARRVWPLVTRWFGPPAAWRVATLLVPAFDAGRQVVGFRRLHLPVPQEGRLPDDLFPARPVVLEFLDWARRAGHLGALAQERVQVIGISYRAAGQAATRRFREWLRREEYADLLHADELIWSVRVVVVPRTTESVATHRVQPRAVFEVLFFLRPDALVWLVAPERLDPARRPDTRGRDRYDLYEGPFCVQFPDRQAGDQSDGMTAELMRQIFQQGRDCPP